MDEAVVVHRYISFVVETLGILIDCSLAGMFYHDKQKKDWPALKIDLSVQLTSQKANFHRGNNKYLAGITAHNLAVVHVLAGETEGVIELFKEAISLKEAAFGSHHFEVALSWDELGIQLFANSQFEEALEAFKAAKSVRCKSEATHPSLAMCLNNIAACDFQMKNHRAALLALQEALEVQQCTVGSSAKGDLDLLHTATVMSNCGYLNLCLKMYDEARTHFEEALLIQQSVLDDHHRAVRDTLRYVYYGWYHIDCYHYNYRLS